MARTSADTHSPEPPSCTHGLRVSASCVLYVPEAQGSLPRGVTHCMHAVRYRDTTGEDGPILGTVTERDVLERVELVAGAMQATRVEQIMTPRSDLASCSTDSALGQCVG
eukprot:scaffold7892_cov62-Phaeocystis_antarctica.AAC.2